MGEVSQVRMDGYEYADLRMFGRDEENYVFIQDPAILKIGHVLTIDGDKKVFVSRFFPVGVISFLNKDGLV